MLYKIKRIILIITIFVFSIGTVNAQIEKLLNLPVTHYDITSFFQAEMPAMMETYDYIYFTGSFRGNLTRLEDEQGYIADTWDALTFQGMAGGQIKLNDMFYIPIFAACSWSENEYRPRGTRIVLPGGHLTSSSIREAEKALGIFAGSGLTIKGELFEGSVFAGYYYGFNESAFSSYIGFEEIDNITVRINNPLPFKIAFMPAVNTNELAIIGNILDKAMGFIGMGELVEVFSGEEQQADYTTRVIVNVLNYGLDFVFSKFILSSDAKLDMKVFYRRDSYDSAARTDTYGTTLYFKWYGMVTRIETGYKHFYYITKNFESRYFDTMYIDINAGYQFHENFSLLFIYNFDAVSRHRFGIGLHFFVADYAIAYGKDEKRGINFMDAAMRIGY